VPGFSAACLRHQELNPLPFVGIFANCTAWLLYGTLTKDPYVYFSNILGLPLGFFFIFTSLKFAPEKVSRSSPSAADQLLHFNHRALSFVAVELACCVH
jgi:hypothetical protein